MIRTQMPKCARPRNSVPIVHLSFAAIVCGALGQACSIVVHGLCRYNTFSSAKVQYTAYSLLSAISIFKHCWLTTGSWKNASVVLESPGIFVTKRVATLSPGKGQFSGHHQADCKVQGIPGISLSYSVGGSSNVTFCCQYCRNLLVIHASCIATGWHKYMH